MTRARARLLVDAAALAAFVLSYLLIPLRLGHLGLGYAVAGVVLVHLAQHGPASLRGLRSSGPARRRAIANLILFILVGLTTATGIWQQSQADMAPKAWHSTVGTVMLLAALGHAWRRRQVMPVWRRLARSRLARARRAQRPATGAGAAAGRPWISRSRS